MYARYTTMEGYLSIRYVCQSIATRFVHSTNNEKEIKIILSRFLRSVYVPTLRSLSLRLVILGKERKRKKKKKNNTTDGEMSYGFRINSRPPNEGT